MSETATGGDQNAFDYPRGLMNSGDYDFSFSGLKTAVYYHWKKVSESERAAIQADVAASFQAAVVDVLVKKTIRAATDAKADRVLVTGGVAANRMLRAEMEKAAAEKEIRVFCPSPRLCTDNAAMIAGVGGFMLARGSRSCMNLNADPRLQLPGVRIRNGM